MSLVAIDCERCRELSSFNWPLSLVVLFRMPNFHMNVFSLTLDKLSWTVLKSIEDGVFPSLTSERKSNLLLHWIFFLVWADYVLVV